ncbi:MAG TPA: putative O-glycosylation ligase, exosortase A system-associated [Allosphingosinicella sp.]|jgi:probable O-glycosylation ligase (exosortase A-associated)
MRDLGFVLYLAALIGLGFKRPFLLVLAFAYIDIVQPQRLSYYLLNSVQVSMIVAAMAFGAWVLFDNKKGARFAPRQGMILLLLVYVWATTQQADFPLEAQSKWDWASKALIWAVFLPLTLRTRLRIEAYLLFMVLSASAIFIVGGIKTAISGGGYGQQIFMLNDNTGLYEGSTGSTFAIAIIPLILWFCRHGTIFPPDWRVKLFSANLIFACLLIPVGTAARTGMLCIAAVAGLVMRDMKRRVGYVILVCAVGVAAVPMLPKDFTGRMDTIAGYEADASATTRLAIWAWTWNYAQSRPFGGGFDAYRSSEIKVETKAVEGTGAVASVQAKTQDDKSRAYHSSYFEMLGEQGFPGLFLFLMIHVGGLVRMEVLRRRFKKADGEDAWISPLATALQHAHIVYLIGSLFVGIAFQPFAYLLVAVQIGLDNTVSAKAREKKPIGLKPAAAAAQ